MTLGITKGLFNWKSQDHSVERFTDNAAYTSAHPDDTLVLAGPPRISDANLSAEATQGPGSLMAIGMVQGFQYSSQKPTQPLQALGSGRLFFVSGKSQTQWNCGRLFCNGRNLVRALYHNAVATNLPVQDFDDNPVSDGGNNEDMYYLNLDSELYYIPFGLAVIFRDKALDLIGAVYLELSMIQSYGVGFNAGQNMIMENVSGMCDRVKNFLPTSIRRYDNPDLRRAMDVTVGFNVGNLMPVTGQALGDNMLSTNSETK